MAEIQYTPMQAFKAEAYCDCGGRLKHTGISLTCAPPLYPHICSECGKTDDLRQVYPSLTYREVEP